MNGMLCTPSPSRCCCWSKWKTHGTPQSGVRPQEAINRQFVRSSDILVGLFWTKIGTSIGIAESGTVENIDLFVASGETTLLYFSRRPIDSNKIDLSYRRDVQKALNGSFTGFTNRGDISVLPGEMRG